MIYVKQSGAITSGDALAMDLLYNTGKDSLEEALTVLGYQPSVHIGREHRAELEVHINSDQDVKVAAIGFVTLGESYETYLFETRHAALIFIKEFAPTIREICEFTIPEDQKY